MKLKTGDKVVVIAGKDKGKEGKIVAVDKKNNRVMEHGFQTHKTQRTEPAGRHHQEGKLHSCFQRNVPA